MVDRARAPLAARQTGRHVIVTGAGTGIGRAIALRMAREGATLTLLARELARLEETAERARELSGAPAGALVCDVRHRDEVDEAVAGAAAERGPITAMIACSGIGGPNAAGPGDRFDDLVATNLGGTYSCLRAAERSLAEGGGTRHLVAVSSILARIGVPGYSGYCASKAGILGLVRALAAELAPREVQVNAICPGWVDTEMAREGLSGMARATGITLEEARQRAMSQVPLGRMSRPEDVAGLAAWLLSEDARGVTGQGIDMNGGAFMI